MISGIDSRDSMQFRLTTWVTVHVYELLLLKRYYDMSVVGRCSEFPFSRE